MQYFLFSSRRVLKPLLATPKLLPANVDPQTTPTFHPLLPVLRSPCIALAPRRRVVDGGVFYQFHRLPLAVLIGVAHLKRHIIADPWGSFWEERCDARLVVLCAGAVLLCWFSTGGSFFSKISSRTVPIMSAPKFGADMIGTVRGNKSFSSAALSIKNHEHHLPFWTKWGSPCSCFFTPP